MLIDECKLALSDCSVDQNPRTGPALTMNFNECLKLFISDFMNLKKLLMKPSICRLYSAIALPHMTRL
jgi:hypothetical protein